MHPTVFVFILLFICPTAPAQNLLPNKKHFRAPIQQTEEVIAVDGQLQEAAWQSATVLQDFLMKYPRDTGLAKRRTLVRLIYDEQYLYVGAVCYDSAAYVVQTLKRDFDLWSQDAFSVVLDPINQTTNGYVFSVTPAGNQFEALVWGGDWDPSWDNKWFVEVQQQADSWTVEMAIPFKSLRYDAGKDRWGINFIRNDLKNNEFSAWAKVPLQFSAIDLGYAGTLEWEHQPPDSRSNLSLIPYASARLEQDQTVDPTKEEIHSNIGVDAKIALTSSLHLDLTVNPDFSQVEVDRQVTNLSRFSIFFPERRNFFLENSDIFNDFGIYPEQPFFSRRIGLDEQGNPIPILYGLRLSGNLDKNWRVGLLNVHTQSKDDTPAQNYTALTFNRQLFQRSVLKGMFLNRQGFPMHGAERARDYGRNATLEFHHLTEDGKWRSWAGYTHSFKPGISDKNQYIHAGTRYNGRRFRSYTSLLHMGSNYYADMGFVGRLLQYDAERDTVVRQGYTQLFNFQDLYFYPKAGSQVISHRISVDNSLYFSPGSSINEWNPGLTYAIVFQNRSNFTAGWQHNYVRLLYSFPITADYTLGQDEYQYSNFTLSYQSDERKLFSWNSSLSGGGFYDGRRWTAALALAYRRQPWGNFGLDLEQHFLYFPGDQRSTLTLVGTRLEINFSRSLFWTTFFQYVTQSNVMNINSRLQWRFAPMSDLYLVYTDNYQVQPFFGPRTRSLALKCRYWLNL
jgi:hypothetical protein